MSLVAGYDSDSEEDTDTGEVEEISKQLIAAEKQISDIGSNPQFEIEDEDNWQSMNHKFDDVQLFSFLPKPKIKTDQIIEELDDEFIRKKPVKEISIAKVKTAETLKESKETSSATCSRSTMSLPKPTKELIKNAKNQKVKISIPSLKDIVPDSDDEDDDQEKKIKPSQKSSTLFSILPKPRHSVTVGNNKNRVFEKQQNRTLVPHSISKKKTESVKQDEQPKTIKPVIDENDDDSDDDISSANFFSLSGSTIGAQNVVDKPTGTSAISTINVDSQDTPSLAEVLPTKVSDDSASVKHPSKNSNINVKVKVNSNPKDMTSITTDTSSSNASNKNNAFFSSLFKSNQSSNKSPFTTSKSTLKQTPVNSSSISGNETKVKQTINLQPQVIDPYSSVTAPYGEVTAPYGEVTGSYGSMSTPYSNSMPTTGSIQTTYNIDNTNLEHSSNNMSYTPGESAHGYPEQGFFAYPYGNTKVQQHENLKDATTDYYNQPNADTGLNEKALQALQGSKRRHEEVNIIDIDASDIQGTKDDYLKNLTIETSYKSKKSKEDEPNRLQRNKHQITYLAHQAKEREFELRQSWADSRSTKQQTQSRYGF